MSTLFKLLLLKIRYMEEEKYIIHLDAMRDTYVMTVINLKTARDNFPPHTKDLHDADVKVGDMVPLKNHTQLQHLTLNIRHI